MSTPILVGALAGLAFGLLYFLPLPAFIAGLGWGLYAALVAVFVALLVIALSSGLAAGITHVLAFGLPVLVICHLAFLSRPRAEGGKGKGAASGSEVDLDEGSKAVEVARPGWPDRAALGAPQGAGVGIEWYPVGRIVGWMLLMAGAFGVLGTLSVGTDLERYRKAVRTILDANLFAQLERLTGRPLSDDDKAAATRFLVTQIPSMLAVTWLLLSLPSLWLGGRIVRASGRLVRPWEPVPAIEYPAFLPLVLVVALLAGLLPGLAGIAAGAMASALLFGYFLLGLAVVHYVTKGHALRAFILAPVYMAVLVLGVYAGIALTIVGIGEPIFRLRARFDAARAGRSPWT